jgi:protocatechuate 4,5-dioxygenase alpha chain
VVDIGLGINYVHGFHHRHGVDRWQAPANTAAHAPSCRCFSFNPQLTGDNAMSVKESAPKPQIAGTTLFDGDQARKGYALNKMCYSFNSAANRAAFLADEEGYCTRFQLTAEQRAAIQAKNVLQLIAAGGNVYYLAKFAGIFGLDVQDLGAQQTGMSKDEFKAMLLAHAH